MRTTFLVGTAALALLLGPLAHATVIARESIEQMTQASEVVIRGRVLRTEAQWDEAHRSIWTYAEVKVEEALKGTAPMIILVRSPGGEVGDIGQLVAGAPRFEVGEDVVLFLFRPPDDSRSFGIHTLSAGKVALKPHLGRLTALRDMRGLTQLERGSKSPEPIDAVENLGPAEKFLTRVRAAVGARR